MSQVVKEGPAVAPRAEEKETRVARHAGPVAATTGRGRAPGFVARIERVEQPVPVRPVAAVAPIRQPVRSRIGVRTVEAVVLLAVAAYFVAGLVGAFVL